MSKVINDAHHIKARPFIVALLFFIIQIGVFILVFYKYSLELFLSSILSIFLFLPPIRLLGW